MAYVGLIVTSIIFELLYQQFSPQIGNMWIRPGTNGMKVFMPSGIKTIILMPFQYLFVWYPSKWDLNWIIIAFALILFQIDSLSYLQFAQVLF